MSNQSITPAGSAGSEGCGWGPAASRTIGTGEPAAGRAGLGFSPGARGATVLAGSPGPGEPFWNNPASGGVGRARGGGSELGDGPRDGDGRGAWASAADRSGPDDSFS